MSKIAFYVRKNQIDKKGLAPIWMKIEINGKRYARSLGYKIIPTHLLKSQLVQKPQKGLKVTYDFEEINKLISWYQVNWLNFLRNKSKDKITEQDVFDFFDRKTETKNEILDAPDFFVAFDQYIQFNKTSRIKPWKPNTIRNKTTVLNKLKEWNKETGYLVSFDKVSKKMYDNLVAWCNSKEFSLNYQDKILVTLKAFLEWCSDEERNYLTNGIHRKFKSITNDVTLIYLTKEEFFAIYDLEITNPSQIKARDIFCFGCLTGQRISDLMNLRHEHIKDDYWYLTTKKTETQHSIYLDPKARAIMNRYDHPVFVLPRLSQSGKSGLNKSIKDVCRLAGITSKIAVTTYPGGIRKETIFDKCDKITMHVARKSYATIMLAENVQTKIIRSGTGHKRDAVFDKYATAVDELKRSETERAFKRPQKDLSDMEPILIEKPDKELMKELVDGLEIRIYNENESFTVSCPMLNISGNGKSIEEAKANFRKGLRERIAEARRKPSENNDNIKS